MSRCPIVSCRKNWRHALIQCLLFVGTNFRQIMDNVKIPISSCNKHWCPAIIHRLVFVGTCLKQKAHTLNTSLIPDHLSGLLGIRWAKLQDQQLDFGWSRFKNLIVLNLGNIFQKQSLSESGDSNLSCQGLFYGHDSSSFSFASRTASVSPDTRKHSSIASVGGQTDPVYASTINTWDKKLIQMPGKHQVGLHMVVCPEAQNGSAWPLQINAVWEAFGSCTHFGGYVHGPFRQKNLQNPGVAWAKCCWRHVSSCTSHIWSCSWPVVLF